MRKPILIITLVLLSAAPCAAQNLMPEPFTNRNIGIEVLHPLVEDEDVGLLTFAASVSARVPLGRVQLLADVPFAFYDDDFTTSQGLGNIMLGVEGAHNYGTFYATLRLPTASEGELANFMAYITDFYRFEAWIPNAVTLSFGAVMRERQDNHGGLDFLLGAAVMGVEETDDVELLLDYGAQYVYRPASIGVTVGVQGRALTTGEGTGFDQRTWHELRARLDYTSGRVRPALGVSVPLDEATRSVFDVALRLGAQVAL